MPPIKRTAHAAPHGTTSTPNVLRLSTFPRLGNCPHLIPGCSFSPGAITARLDSGGETHPECGHISPVSHHILHPCKLPKLLDLHPHISFPPSLPRGSMRSTREFQAMCELCWCPWQNGSPQKSPQHLHRSKWLTTLIGKEIFPSQTRPGELMQPVYYQINTHHILVILAD